MTTERQRSDRALPREFDLRDPRRRHRERAGLALAGRLHRRRHSNPDGVSRALRHRAARPTHLRNFAPVWSARSGDALSDRMNDLPKYVVSTTLADPSWQNTTVIDHDPDPQHPRAEAPARRRHRAIRLRSAVPRPDGVRTARRAAPVAAPILHRRRHDGRPVVPGGLIRHVRAGRLDHPGQRHRHPRLPGISRLTRPSCCEGRRCETTAGFVYPVVHVSNDRRMTQRILQTERLTLFPLAEEHLELEVELDSDPAVMRYLTGRALSREEVE